MSEDVAHDTDLLRQYAAGSEAAFRELVQRHLGMVHATARRVLTTAPHLAEDVTQAVFTDLAKKSTTLPTGVVLGGWLHRHACYVALNAARAEHRRHTRERTAMEINAVNENPGTDAQWAQLAPVLDDALNHLNTEDRDAIVLRYLEQRDLRSIGLALGSNEDAAQKRVTRALEKLRAFFAGRGITLSSALLTASLDAGAASTPAAPGLATAISAKILHEKNMRTPKLAIGAAATIAASLLILFVITQNASPLSPVAQSAPVAETTPTKASTPVITAAKVEAPKTTPAPAGDMGPLDNAASQDLFLGDLTNTPIIGLTAPPANPATTSAAPPPAAAAGEAPDTYSNGYTDGSTKMITVTSGQLSMTTKYANGTISTVPYTEAGATVTITPGDKPNTYVLTFRNEVSGKINLIIKGVPNSADYSATLAK